MQDRTRRLMRVFAILAVAAAAGQLVQSVNAARERSAALPRPQGLEHVAAGPATDALPRVVMPASLPPLPGMSPADRAAAVLPTADSVRPMLPGPEAAPPALSAEPGLDLPGTATVAACPDALVLRAGPQATIGLSLSAPCHAGERVVVRHAGLAVTGRLGKDGTLSLALPGLAEAAEVSVLFTDGSRAEGTVALPDAAQYRRFAVQWQGADEFQLHAFEEGADEGDPGHVWAGAPHLPVLGQPASGGWMVSLGDASVPLPLHAAVYTFPSRPGPEPLLVIEAPVTEATCGREMLGETLVAAAGVVQSGDLSLAMPDCSAVGDILVLNNLAPALKIAATN